MASHEQGPGNLGSKLRELRLARGLSLREAARLLGLSHSRLSDFESGKTHSTDRLAVPGPDLLQKAAEVYRYPRQTLLALAGYPDASSSLRQPSGAEVDLAEISAIFGRLGAPERRLFLEIARTFDRFEFATQDGGN